MQIGVIGLGRMGGNISRRAHIEPKDQETRPS
jgi:6-phosphogluconate dehydrogenase (decarboxylating)